jgi:hypothetical protein
MAVLGTLVLAFAIDGLNSYMHLFPNAPSLYEPQNWLRLLTGTGMGVVIAAALYPAFNQAAWKHWEARPALGGLRSLGWLLILGLLLDLVILTENPLVLYPLSLVSAASVFVLLTMVYSLVWLVVFRAENKYSHLHQMSLPLMSGFGMALLQIALLDLIRYLLTGTWDGFHLG